MTFTFILFLFLISYIKSISLQISPITITQQKTLNYIINCSNSTNFTPFIKNLLNSPNSQKITQNYLKITLENENFPKYSINIYFLTAAENQENLCPFSDINFQSNLNPYQDSNFTLQITSLDINSQSFEFPKQQAIIQNFSLQIQQKTQKISNQHLFIDHLTITNSKNTLKFQYLSNLSIKNTNFLQNSIENSLISLENILNFQIKNSNFHQNFPNKNLFLNHTYYYPTIITIKNQNQSEFPSILQNLTFSENKNIKLLSLQNLSNINISDLFFVKNTLELVKIKQKIQNHIGFLLELQQIENIQKFENIHLLDNKIAIPDQFFNFFKITFIFVQKNVFSLNEISKIKLKNNEIQENNSKILILDDPYTITFLYFNQNSLKNVNFTQISAENNKITSIKQLKLSKTLLSFSQENSQKSQKNTINISNSNFQNNENLTILQDTPLPYLQQLSNSHFTNNTGPQILIQKKQQITQTQENQLTIKNTTFTNNKNLIIIEEEEDQYEYIYKYEDVYLSQGGAAVNIEGFSSEYDLVILFNNTFNNNSNMGQYTFGGSLFFSDINELYIGLGDDSESFSNYIYDSYSTNNGGGIYIQNAQNILLVNLHLLNCTTLNKGGGLYIKNSQYLTLESSLIKQNNANSFQGGGLYLQNIDNFFLQDTQISKNQATKGAGLYISDETKKIYLENSQFSQNQAQYGAAIYLEIQFLLVKFYLKNIKIQKNKAEFAAAIYFQYTNRNQNFIPKILSSKFLKNTAKYQGGAFFFQFFAPNQLKNKPFLDLITFKNNTFHSNKVLLGNGSLLKIVPSIPHFLQKQTETLQNFTKNNKNTTEIDLIIGCQQGEIQQFPVYFCTICPEQTFIFTTQAKYCLKCPENAICQGQYQGIKVLPGYWRSHTNSTKILQCPNQQSCKGETSLKQSFFEQNYSKTSEICDENYGYQGILCQECAKSYYKTSHYICGKCNKAVQIIVSICIQFILQTSLILIIAFLNMKSSKKLFLIEQLNKISPKKLKIQTHLDNLINIILLYFQTLMISIAVIPELQTRLQFFLSYMLSSVQLSSNIMCLLPPILSLSDQVSQVLYEFLFKLCQLTLLFCLKYLRKQQLNIPLMTYILALLKLQVPTIVTLLCENLMYTEIDDRKLVYNNYSQEFGSESYLYQNLLFLLPPLLFLTIFLPILQFMKLKQFKKSYLQAKNSQKNAIFSLEKKKQIDKYGIFFGQQRFIYWQLTKQQFLVLITIALYGFSNNSIIVGCIFATFLAIYWAFNLKFTGFDSYNSFFHETLMVLIGTVLYGSFIEAYNGKQEGFDFDVYKTPFIGVLFSVILLGNLYILVKFLFYIVVEFREFLEVMEECEQKTCLRKTFSCLIRSNSRKRRKKMIDNLGFLKTFVQKYTQNDTVDCNLSKQQLEILLNYSEFQQDIYINKSGSTEEFTLIELLNQEKHYKKKQK